SAAASAAGSRASRRRRPRASGRRPPLRARARAFVAPFGSSVAPSVLVDQIEKRPSRNRLPEEVRDAEPLGLVAQVAVARVCDHGNGGEGLVAQLLAPE